MQFNTAPARLWQEQVSLATDEVKHKSLVMRWTEHLITGETNSAEVILMAVGQITKSGK